MEDLNQLLRLPGCYGNQHFPSIIHDNMVTSILPISSLIYGVERQMRYQIDQHMTVLKSKKYMLVRMKKMILVFIQYNKSHQIVSQSF